MSDQPSVLASIPAAVKASFEAVPPDKTGVLMMGVEWKYGVPFAKFGTAIKVGDHFKLSGDAETRFSKLSTRAKAYAVWSW